MMTIEETALTTTVVGGSDTKVIPENPPTSTATGKSDTEAVPLVNEDDGDDRQ